VKRQGILLGGSLSWWAVAVLVACSCVRPAVTPAQTTGPNAVFGANGATQSLAFIDAAQFTGPLNETDFCARVNGALVSLQNSPGVIDARGIAPVNSTMACPVNTYQGNQVAATPWVYSDGNVQSIANVPGVTILLPAGNINIPTTWVLPDRTRLVGEHTANPNGGTQSTITAASDFSASDTSNSIIEMGSFPLCPNGCTGISVEHLTVNSQASTAVNGIYNAYAGDQSYVNDIALTNMSLTGVIVASLTGESFAIDSGPYSNINFVSNGSSTACQSGSPCPACVQLNVQTRGVHNLTCIGSAYTKYAGVAGLYVDASNNLIEDAHIESFWDGIEIGNANAGASAIGNIVISNVDGATKGYCNDYTKHPTTPIINLIHLCGPNIPLNRTTCSGTYVGVSDVIVVGAKLESGSTGSEASATIEDDLADDAITLPDAGSPFTVGFYALGEQATGTGTFGYSRITSSATTAVGNSNTTKPISVPTWGIGSSAPGTPGETCAHPGTIYSNTGTGSVIWLCTASGWEPLT
jgi:hypothetical protein